MTCVIQALPQGLCGRSPGAGGRSPGEGGGVLERGSGLRLKSTAVPGSVAKHIQRGTSFRFTSAESAIHRFKYIILNLKSGGGGLCRGGRLWGGGAGAARILQTESGCCLTFAWVCKSMLLWRGVGGASPADALRSGFPGTGKCKFQMKVDFPPV